MTAPAPPRHTTQLLDNGAVVHPWRPGAGTPEPRGAVVLQHGFGEYAERYVTFHHGLIGVIHLVLAFLNAA